MCAWAGLALVKGASWGGGLSLLESSPLPPLPPRGHGPVPCPAAPTAPAPARGPRHSARRLHGSDFRGDSRLPGFLPTWLHAEGIGTPSQREPLLRVPVRRLPRLPGPRPVPYLADGAGDSQHHFGALRERSGAQCERLLAVRVPARRARVRPEQGGGLCSRLAGPGCVLPDSGVPGGDGRHGEKPGTVPGAICPEGVPRAGLSLRLWRTGHAAHAPQRTAHRLPAAPASVRALGRREREAPERPQPAPDPGVPAVPGRTKARRVLICAPCPQRCLLQVGHGGTALPSPYTVSLLDIPQNPAQKIPPHREQMVLNVRSEETGSFGLSDLFLMGWWPSAFSFSPSSCPPPPLLPPPPPSPSSAPPPASASSAVDRTPALACWVS